MTTTPRVEPGARWLRCDLHVHTPFDGEKEFGEDIRGAIQALKNADVRRLAGVAERFVEACRTAGGHGVDLVALTDHNSIEGYKRLKPQFQSIAQRAHDEGKSMPVVLPGVEFSVGGERPLHFLTIFASNTRPDAIEGLIGHVFQERTAFAPKTGTPRATGESVSTFLERLYRYARPSTGERDLRFVLLPAHAETDRGVARESGVHDLRVATSLWDEMRGHLRQWAVARTEWNGFETAQPFDRLPQAFQDLLCRWTVAKQAKDWDQLQRSDRQRVQQQGHWPLVECSDPHNYDALGSRFTWLKMEVPDVEGIRLALLDPQSRLRRMAEGLPSRTYPRIERLSIRGTDFFQDNEIPVNPCLTSVVGGRGTGKSTIIEYLRHALGRDRREDLKDDEPNYVSEAVQSVLSNKRDRDFGRTNGTLLPGYEIRADIIVAERRYSVRRSASGFEVIQDPDQPSAQPSSFDVRSLVAPRFLSQRQIASIARDPASQRTELDALIDTNRLREIENRRRSLVETLTQLQTTRTRLREQGSKLPTAETELQKVRDQITFLESDDRKEVLGRFDDFERTRRWLEDCKKELTDVASRLDEEAATVEQTGAGAPPESTSPSPWVGYVADRIRTAREAVATVLRDQASALRTLETTLTHEQGEQWQVDYNQARSAYDALRHDMTERGVDFAQHEKLLQRRAQLDRELLSLRKTDQELDEIARKIHDTHLQLVETHEARLAARREQAQLLEAMDADVRLEVLPFRDREDFESRREQWFGGAGLQERDWTVLCDHVFAANGQVPDRIDALVKAIRNDVEATITGGEALDATASKVVALVGPEQQLTRNFFNAIARRDRVRLDEIERFLPEDFVKTQVRMPESSFKTIETGSVGEKSTAILSLLLSAGDQPIIIDQPEDDLDNQYVYNIVVDLLRRRKFLRQIIVATHNANIPVNGDAELIVALGVEDQMGVVLGAGSIDQPEVKNLVSVIMEGSAEAFRLRRERYGY